MKRILALVAVAMLGNGARAEVRLASLFSDNMVVQRETAAAFWGWAQPGEKIAVTASWGATASATAAADGS